jgi:glycosyltransferase involved in cell wall biosynthesis
MVNFSICLIVRDEAKTILRCVSSLIEFQKRGGEIVVLDTGSKDSTVQIAKDLGCKVFEAGNKYQHAIDKELAEKINERFVVEGEKDIVNKGDKYFSFYEARNHAASLASNNWVSFMDSDEVMTHLNIDEIEKIIEDKTLAHLEYNFIYAHSSNGAPAVSFRQSKFYDKTKMKWYGSVHEVLNGMGGVKYLEPETFLLEHFQEPHDRHSYIVGLAVDCYLNSANDRNSHYLSREMMYNGRYKSAIKEFQRHIKFNGWLAEKAQSLIYIGDCFGFLNEPAQQCEYYFKAFHTDPNRRESLIKLARFYQHNNVPKSAAAFAAAALQIPKNDYYANQQEDYEDAPHSVLYWAKGWMGDIEGAKEHLLKCLEYQPYNEIYLRDTSYYFEYPNHNEIEGWMRFQELQWLFEESKKHKVIVEIGSWKGKSTNAILSGCKDGVVYAVDTWEGSKDERDDTHWLAQKENVFKTFKKNTAQFGNLKTICKTSTEAAKEFKNNSIDFCFIDAGHTKEEVQEDILAWLPKMKRDGIISGHDFDIGTWMSVYEGVESVFGKPDGVCDSIWWVDLSKHIFGSSGFGDGTTGIGFSGTIRYEPMVTIIIPTLGRIDGLERCLTSINNLDYPKNKL